MMPRRPFKLMMIVACVLWILTGCAAKYAFHGMPLNEPEAAPDFTLTDHNGQPFRLSEQRGNVVVVFFGFTSCPDTCPTTLADLAVVRQRLGSEADRLKIVMVTVDPGRDTQDALRRYMTGFDRSFTGLRGTESELASVYQAYGVTHIASERQSHDALADAPANPVHSEYRYVIDKAGRWRVLHSISESIDDTISDLQFLLRERV